MKRLCSILICLWLAGPVMAQDAPGTITTIIQQFSSAMQAGTGSLTGPTSLGSGSGGLAADVRGNLYMGAPTGDFKFSVRLLDGNIKILVGSPNNRSKSKDFADGTSATANGFVSSTGALESGSSIYLTAGLDVDLDGSVYIAAPYDQRIRRVDSEGYIWTAAGSGIREFSPTNPLAVDVVRGGFSGDGGTATQAQLLRPSDVALDAQGNLYIADSGNGRIRMVNREGYIYTFAGNGGKQTDPLGDGGLAINAMLYTPVSVAVDLKGNVYVAELYAHRVRKIASDEQHTITTFAGTGQAGYSGDGGLAAQAKLNFPMGIAVDMIGNVYIADRENHRVRKVDTGGTITTFAGNGTSGIGSFGDGGSPLQARLDYPRDIVVDARGYVYISHDISISFGGAAGRLRCVIPEKPFAIPSIQLSSTAMSFVPSNANISMDQFFTISNTGKEMPLLVEVVTDRYAPEWKVVSQTKFLVQPGGSQTVTVRYTPTSLTNTSSTLKVYHSGAEENPLTVRLNAVPGTTKSADFDGDGRVGLDDFFLFAGVFGKAVTEDDAKYDLDGSGKVDFDDFFLFAGKFGK